MNSKKQTNEYRVIKKYTFYINNNLPCLDYLVFVLQYKTKKGPYLENTRHTNIPPSINYRYKVFVPIPATSAVGQFTTALIEVR